MKLGFAFVPPVINFDCLSQATLGYVYLENHQLE